MSTGLPRRDIGIIVVVAALLGGGIIASAMLLPTSEASDTSAADHWLEVRDAVSVPPAVADDPRGIVPVPHLFPLPEGHLARQP